MFAVNIDEERERYANESEVKIIRYEEPLSFSKIEMKRMGFSDTKIKVYRPGNKRKSSGSSKPVTIKNQKYPSMTVASEQTGIPITLIGKFAKGLIDEKELLLRNAKRLMREEANRAYGESEENNS